MRSIEFWQAGDYNRAMSEFVGHFEPVSFSGVLNEVYEKKMAYPNSPVGYELASKCVEVAIDLLKSQKKDIDQEFVFEITHHPEDFDKIKEISKIKYALGMVIDDFEVRHDYVGFSEAVRGMAKESVMHDMKQGVFWGVVANATQNMGIPMMN